MAEPKKNYPNDTLVKWDPKVPAEVERARKTFDKLVVDNKQRAFTVRPDGGQGSPVSAFDPSVGKIICSPRPAVDHLEKARQSLKRVDRFRGQTSQDDFSQLTIAHALVSIAESLSDRSPKREKE
jgi:hypothetical protein